MSHPHPELSAPGPLPENGLRVIPLGGLGEVEGTLLGGLGVEGEVAGIEGKEGEEKKNARAKDGEGDDLLAEAGSGAGGFWFSHGKRVCLMKRTDGFFQGKFAGAGSDLGDNLSPGLWPGSEITIHG